MQTERCVNPVSRILATNPLSTRFYGVWMFQVIRINRRYHFRVYRGIDFIHDSGGVLPEGYDNLMTATKAHESWLAWQRLRGTIE